MTINVSIIIPAFNAADTVAETIESVLHQTSGNWEIIVVDDGSTDNTLEVVGKYSASENRIRCISQSNQGVGAARNAGIKNARFEWLLFLDSDDWISEKYFERMTAVILDHPDFDAVHCGWKTMSNGNNTLGDKYAPTETYLFPAFVGGCVLVIHSCVIRKSIVEICSGFDTSFAVCADWDFWQRVSRAGAKFIALQEVLAFYRMRRNSMSKNVKLSVETAMKIIEQGHSYDARVKFPNNDFLEGASKEKMNDEKLFCVTWFAGMFIGQNEDATSLLDVLGDECKAVLNPHDVAFYLMEAICFSRCESKAAWLELWLATHTLIHSYLTSLEHLSKSKGLRDSTLACLEYPILNHNLLLQPLKIGKVLGIRLNVSSKMDNIKMPKDVEQIYCIVEMDGSDLGSISLAVSNPAEIGNQIKDTIASKYSWQIIGNYFGYTIYSKITQSSQSILKNQSFEEVHDEIGWKTFKDQIWSEARIYKRRSNKISLRLKGTANGFKKLLAPVFEISEDLPESIYFFTAKSMALTIGGVVAYTVVLPVRRLINRKELRSLLIDAGGYELCRVCVREALVGKPLNEQTSLQQRLKQRLVTL